MRAALLLAFIVGLAGCGAVYIPAEVRTNDPQNPVQVVAIDSNSLLSANAQTSYTPRRLPDSFRQTAGTGAGMRGLGALPEAPFQPESRPASLSLILPPPFEPRPYQIGVGDVLVLATPTAGSSVEELSGLLAAQNRRQGYTVQDDGTITIPDVGRVNVLDLTVAEAEAAVFDRLVQSQIDPSFSLEISEFNSQRVSLGGAVRNPIIVPIRLGEVTLDEAITAAGGLEVADRAFASIRIYRDGTVYQIPLRDFDARNDLRRLPLKDGDSVFVDTEFSLDRAQAYFEQQIRISEIRESRRASALAELQIGVNLRRQQLQEQRDNFASQLELDAVERDYVYIAGEVVQQSRYPLPFETQASLADALFGSGGIDPITGNPSQIYVLRQRDGGAGVTAWQLDGSNAANMVLATRFEMRPDDVIFVAEQPVTSWNRVVQQIVPSIITTSVAAATN